VAGGACVVAGASVAGVSVAAGDVTGVIAGASVAGVVPRVVAGAVSDVSTVATGVDVAATAVTGTVAAATVAVVAAECELEPPQPANNAANVAAAPSVMEDRIKRERDLRPMRRLYANIVKSSDPPL
jgi:hypothetical protein